MTTTDKIKEAERSLGAAENEVATLREAAATYWDRLDAALAPAGSLLFEGRALALRAERAVRELRIRRRLAGLDDEDVAGIDAPASREVRNRAELFISRETRGHPEPGEERRLDMLAAIEIATDPRPAREVPGLDRGRGDLIREKERLATSWGRFGFDPAFEKLVEAAVAEAERLASRDEG